MRIPRCLVTLCFILAGTFTIGIIPAHAAAGSAPGTAILLSPAQAASDFLLREGEIKWFVINQASQAKITVRLEVPALSTVNYNLQLYTYDADSGALIDDNVSEFGANTNEQISKIVSPGQYFIAVKSATGFSADKPFRLTYRNTATQDASEGDDSPWQASALILKPSLSDSTGNTDNSWDEDWRSIDLPQASKIYLQIGAWTQNQTTYPFGNQIIEVFNSSYQLEATVNPPKPIILALAAGRHYLRIRSSTQTPATFYRVQFAAPATASRINVTQVSSDPNVQGFIDYGQGNKWRVKGDTVLYGVAFDAFGNQLANATVQVNIPVSIGAPVNELVLTNTSGTFTLPMTLPPARGSLMFTASRSYHYYDIVGVRLTSNLSPVNANISDFYHFAYQVYHP